MGWQAGAGPGSRAGEASHAATGTGKREVVEELPLARVENQQYSHCQKGSLAMCWLKDAVGEAAVNRALAAMLKPFAFKEASCPNTLDFLTLLRAEAGPRHDALINYRAEKLGVAVRAAGVQDRAPDRDSDDNLVRVGSD